jgi:DNA repair exonuclease SbcCD ATPase subunit
MLVRRVQGRGIAKLADFDERLPERGIVCVTGRNGKGKTLRFIEAAAWAVWGETLRGTPLGQQAKVTATLDTHFVHRTTKGKDFLWNRTGEPPEVYTTPSKAAAALEAELGTFEAWRRSSVFSSADGALFSTAQDADRKRFLERLIGLDVFDKATLWLKSEVDSAQEHLAHAKLEESKLVAQIAQLKATVSDLYEVLEQSQPQIDLEALHTNIASLNLRRQARYLDYQRLSQELGAAKGELSVAARQQLRHNNGKCYACDQLIPEELLESQRLLYEAANTKLAELERNLSADLQAAHREVHQLDHEILALSKQIPQNVTALTSVREKVEIFREQGRQAVRQLGEVRSDLMVAQNRVRINDCAKGVLGTRGYRATILGRALASVTELANTYLSWLSDDIRVRLTDHVITGSGTTQNKILMEVEGRGGGHGYDALSGGERRRVDLVLLLSLASLNGGKGTLFFDEAFDALDEEGVEACARLLEHISEKRPVVVITHNNNLKKHLKGSVREL